AGGAGRGAGGVQRGLRRHEEAHPETAVHHRRLRVGLIGGDRAAMAHPEAASIPAAIEARLRRGLAPDHLEIGDESARHAGHAGAASGGGHYRVLVVAGVFEGRARVERHRMVYDLLSDLMPAAIHALALRTLAPSEWPAA